MKGSAPPLVLDSPDRLNLGSLGVGAKLAVTLVLSSATVVLHDILVATISGVLVAHKAAEINKNTFIKCIHLNNPVKQFQIVMYVAKAASNIMTMDLRSALNVHGSNLVVHPAHGLQRRVVITQLKLTTHHVLRLVDGHAGLLVVLYEEGEGTTEMKLSLK